jgi:predicted ATP-grasp superfamily ATP-dependent carboligase
MSNFITPDSIVVDSGVAHFPETPQSVFYHTHNPDLVIFESNAHAGGDHDIEIMRAILELAKELNTSRIYTAAALPQSISHSALPQILFACNNQNLKSELEKKNISPMSEGLISGLNGLLLGFAAANGIDAVCLLATIPAYAAGLTYPKAALEIVKKFAEISDADINVEELQQEVENADPMFADVEERLKDFFSSGLDGPDIDTGSEVEKLSTDDVKVEKNKEDVPKIVMDRIERMFNSAVNDKSKAQALKSELDKWGLYKLYEDRFLDLFE